MKCVPTNVKFIYVHPYLDARRKPELKKWNKSQNKMCSILDK